LRRLTPLRPCASQGDISPETVQGKVVGILCASLGVVLLAIPAGIFISGEALP